MATVNFLELIKEAEDGGAQVSFEPIPAGDYACSVKEAKAQTSKKGDPQLVITFKVDDGDHKNRQLWSRMTFIPGNKTGNSINIRQLGALGAGDLLLQNPPLEQVAAFLTGKRAKVVVGFGKGDYADKNEIKDVKKAEAVTLSPLQQAAAQYKTGPRPF